MIEESEKDKSKKKEAEYGPLRAEKGPEDEYTIVGEDWGGLKAEVEKKELRVGDRVGTHGIYMGERGVYDQRNRLNDLTGRDWAIFTKSWFVHNPPPRTKDETLHPAKFPESMIADFIKFFTKKGNLVLDPMLGTGSTLVACDKTGRRGVGIELTKKWADIARGRTGQTVIQGDAKNLVELLDKNLPFEKPIRVDFCITSPPYWNMLKKSRGHVFSSQKKRKSIGLDEYYSENPDDFGNIDSYEKYLDAMYDLFAKVYEVLKPGGYLVIICQNILTPEGDMVPFAWDIAIRLSKLYLLKQERIWLQDNKFLGIWGYPFRYVSNVHHHYCLILEKDHKTEENEETEEDGQEQ
jgi:DNA modification methylase